MICHNCATQYQNVYSVKASIQVFRILTMYFVIKTRLLYNYCKIFHRLYICTNVTNVDSECLTSLKIRHLHRFNSDVTKQAAVVLEASSF